MLHRSQIYAAGGFLESFIDFSIVPDTPDYIPSVLQDNSTAANLDVISGLWDTTADGESSFYYKNEELDLTNESNVYIETLDNTFTTSSGKLVLFFSDSETPPNHTIITSAITGYDVTYGSGSTGLVNRVVAGTRTQIGTFTYNSYVGDDIRLTLEITGASVTIRGYKNGVETTGSPIVDTDPARITDIKSAGIGIRQPFSAGLTLSGIRAGTF